MRIRFSAFFIALICLCPFSAFAFEQWQQPTADELKMTSDSAAPDAPAVYLYREEVSDDRMHMHSLYVRIKILTEKGKSYADVEIPYESHNFAITDVQGRTIHSDGSIVPFTGKPYDKLLVKSKTKRYSAKVFSMPAVEVGSILEYKYKLRYDDNVFLSPEWDVQQALYVHKAHFRFMPASTSLTLVNERGSAANYLLHWDNLPKGSSIKNVGDHYELDVHDIPAEPDEDFMPPLRTFNYRVFFYYSPFTNGVEFWKAEGKYWSKKMDHFANPSAALASAAAQITAGADTQEKKLSKLYDAVMALDNTDFTRKQSEQERKANGVKEAKNAEDIWKQKRGSSDEIALLFLAMVRASGMKAFAMQVVNRNNDLFNVNILSSNQLDDVLVIVNVDGKERWFDPGSKFCKFGQLHWKHTWAGGLRQTDQGPILGPAPEPSYPDNQERRTAILTMDDSGEIHGTVILTMGGSIALRWRQTILRNDEEEARQDLEKELNEIVPAGLKVTIKGFTNKDSSETPLIATGEIKGNAGSMTQTRSFFPIEVFEARNVSSFVNQPKRQSPIDLRYPYIEADQVTVTLPASWSIESAPKPTVIPYPNMAQMKLDSKVSGNTVMLTRVFALGNTLYKAEEYADVHTFYEKVNTADQQQLVLKRVSQAKGQ